MEKAETKDKKKSHTSAGKLDAYAELELFFPKIPVPDFEGDCKGMPMDWWFPEQGHDASQNLTLTRAREICYNCPVQKQCLEFALNFPNLQGIWGGLSPRQRTDERRRRYRAKAKRK